MNYEDVKPIKRLVPGTKVRILAVGDNEPEKTQKVLGRVFRVSSSAPGFPEGDGWYAHINLYQEGHEDLVKGGLIGFGSVQLAVIKYAAAPDVFSPQRKLLIS